MERCRWEEPPESAWYLVARPGSPDAHVLLLLPVVNYRLLDGLPVWVGVTQHLALGCSIKSKLKILTLTHFCVFHKD